MRQFQPPPGHTDYPHCQPPQYPPQPETNSWNPQLFPSQQFKHPLFDLPPGQPQIPKRNARKRLPVAALIAAVMVAVFTAALFIHELQLVPAPRSISRTTHPAGQPMQASTSQAISQPTSRAKPALAIIGSDTGAFVAMYGQPNNHSVLSAGLFDVQYIYRSKTIINSCGILIGTEQTQL